MNFSDFFTDLIAEYCPVIADDGLSPLLLKAMDSKLRWLACACISHERIFGEHGYETRFTITGEYMGHKLAVKGVNTAELVAELRRYKARIERMLTEAGQG